MNFIYLVILSIVTLLFFTTNQVADGHQPHDTKIISPCPEANSNTKGVLKEFLTIPEWSSARQETNTDNIDTSQIMLLQDSVDSSICEEFNNQYEEALTEEWESGGKTYDVTYYKADNFYFVKYC